VWRGMSPGFWVPHREAAAGAGVARFLGGRRNTSRHLGASASSVLMASVESRPAGVEPLIAAHFTFVSVRGNSTPDLDLPSGGVIEFRAAPVSRMTVPRYRVTLLRADPGVSF